MTNPNEPINTIDYTASYTSGGLTKREYFASMAMQGILSNPNNHSFTQKAIAISSVEMADALIKELNEVKVTFKTEKI